MFHEGASPCHPDGHRLESCRDPQLALDLLADERARKIVRIAATPMSVSEIADRLDLPLSTAYRKVEKLEAAGLLERVTPDADSGPPDRYRKSVEAITIRLHEDDRTDRPASEQS